MLQLAIVFQNFYLISFIEMLIFQPSTTGLMYVCIPSRKIDWVDDSYAEFLTEKVLTDKFTKINY